MNTGKYVFAQVASFLNFNEFNKCIQRHNGNYKVKEYTCWHQLLCLNNKISQNALIAIYSKSLNLRL